MSNGLIGIYVGDGCRVAYLKPWLGWHVGQRLHLCHALHAGSASLSAIATGASSDALCVHGDIEMEWRALW